MDTRTKVFWIMGLLLAFVLIGCGPSKPPDQMPITTSSDEARQLYLKAWDCRLNAELTQASALINQAIQKDPYFALAYLERSNTDASPDQAKQDIGKAKSLIEKVSEGEQQYIKVVDLVRNEKTEEANQAMEKLLASYPKDKYLQFRMGFRLFTRDPKKGLPYFEEAIKLDPNFAVAYNSAGYVNMALGNMDAAEKAFQSYMKLRPDGPNPYDSYAEFLRNKGQFDESVTYYQKALSVDPTFVLSMLGMGDSYLRKGDLKNALAQYEAFTEKATLATGKLNGYYRHAAAHVIEGNVPEALAVLDERKALALKENLGQEALDAVIYQSAVLGALGKPDLALKKYQEGLEWGKTLNIPDSVQKENQFWANPYMAYFYIEANNMKKAKECLSTFEKDAGTRKSTAVEFWLKATQGDLALKEGRLDDAIRILTSLKQEPFVLHALSVAYMKKGDKQKAQVALDKLKQQEITLPWAIEVRQAAINRGV